MPVTSSFHTRHRLALSSRAALALIALAHSLSPTARSSSARSSSSIWVPPPLALALVQHTAKAAHLHATLNEWLGAARAVVAALTYLVEQVHTVSQPLSR